MLVSEKDGDAYVPKSAKLWPIPTRRRDLLGLLRQREMSAGEIAEHFDLAKPTLSGHFAVLRAADLVQSLESTATVITYRLNISVLEEALLCALMNGFPPSARKGTTPS